MPDEAHQGLRDLVRCRQDAKTDRRRARNRLEKMLREGLQPPPGTKPWTQSYWKWLGGLQLEPPSKHRTLRDYLAEAEHQEQRLQQLEEELPEQLQKLPEPMQRSVAALQCLYGVQRLTAATVVAEAGEMSRFATASQLFSYAGMVPSEHSSGGPQGQHRGGLTKTGNAHLRAVLVESAWHYRNPPRVSSKLRQRRMGQDPVLIQMAEAAHRRLYRRFTRLVHKGKPPPKVVVAVGRELLGFMWAIVKQAQAGGFSQAATSPQGLYPVTQLFTMAGALHIEGPTQDSQRVCSEAGSLPGA